MVTNRTKLIDAARVELFEFGSDGARVDRIAARAGLNKRLIYHYFQDKDGLCGVVVHHCCQRLLRSTSAATREFIEHLAEHLGASLRGAETETSTSEQDELRMAASIVLRRMLATEIQADVGDRVARTWARACLELIGLAMPNLPPVAADTAHSHKPRYRVHPDVRK